MKTRIALATALVLALIVAGAAMGAAGQSASGTRITLHKTKFGKVLATSTGMTLYLYTPDGKNKRSARRAS